MRVQTLYEFLVLTTKLNFTETAKMFFVSQSVLSDHILRLEKELGVKLFVRDRHSVRLTEAGRIFKETAQASAMAPMIDARARCIFSLIMAIMAMANMATESVWFKSMGSPWQLSTFIRRGKLSFSGPLKVVCCGISR